MTTETTKKSKKWYQKRKFIVSVIGFVLLIWVCFEVSAFLTNNNNESKALLSCQQLYGKKVDKFSKATGITAGNVVFNSPKITQKRNLYIFNFDDITLGNQKDYFVCYYNVQTGKSTDRTPDPKFENND
jgi:hypothetical protein